MKNTKLAFTLFLAFIFTLCTSAQKKESYDIKITVKGLKEGAMCLLANYYGEKQYIKDSAKANANGEVVFKGDSKLQEGVYLFVLPTKKYFDFIMDGTQHFSLETDTTDFIKTTKIKGSDENKYFYEYQTYMQVKQKQVEPLRSELKTLRNKDSIKIVQDKLLVFEKEIKEYKSNFIKNYPKTFVAKLFKAMDEPEVPEAPILANGRKDSTFSYRYYKYHYWDNWDFADDRLMYTPVFHNKIKFYMDKLTPQTPDSINVSTDILVKKSKANKEVFKYIVYWLTYNYESSNIMGMDAVFVHMVDMYYVTKEAYWVDSTQLYKITNRAYTLKPLLIGKKAPLINMPDSTGKYISINDIKAKYTVVIFWDHGCGHCKKEIPKLAEAYKNKLKQKGVQVYAIETEDKPEEWKKFVKEHQLNWINVCETDDYKRAVTKKIYDIYSTPVIYVLDENKIIRAKRIDSEQIEGIIDALEKEKDKK